MNDVLARLRPSQAQQQELQELVDRLVAKVQAALGDAGVVTVQGSTAKDTWLAGSKDIDMFLLFPTSMEEANFEAALQQAATPLANVQQKYAQHPYLIGQFEGVQVDLVPAYAVASATDRMSAVDRTPFHTAWVNKHLTAKQRDDVRLAKAWSKGVGIYGAETSQGGFSGYLIELMIGALGTFEAFVGYLAALPTRRLVPGEDRCDMDAPLVVPDPVDPARNTAAAVVEDVLKSAQEAAHAYLAEPGEWFFFPPTPTAKSPETLADLLQDKNMVWSAVLWEPKTKRLDLVYPQFQKAGRVIAAQLERRGHQVLRHSVDEQGAVLFQVLAEATPLPATKWHQGPPEGNPNAKKFLAKWQSQTVVAGPEVHEGAWRVQVAEPLRTPAEWLQAQLPSQPLGKHVLQSKTTQYHDVHHIPTAWLQTASDFITNRKPWQ